MYPYPPPPPPPPPPGWQPPTSQWPTFAPGVAVPNVSAGAPVPNASAADAPAPATTDSAPPLPPRPANGPPRLAPRSNLNFPPPPPSPNRRPQLPRRPVAGGQPRYPQHTPAYQPQTGSVPATGYVPAPYVPAPYVPANYAPAGFVPPPPPPPPTQPVVPSPPAGYAQPPAAPVYAQPPATPAYAQPPVPTQAYAQPPTPVYAQPPAPVYSQPPQPQTPAYAQPGSAHVSPASPYTPQFATPAAVSPVQRGAENAASPSPVPAPSSQDTTYPPPPQTTSPATSPTPAALSEQLQSMSLSGEPAAEPCELSTDPVDHDQKEPPAPANHPPPADHPPPQRSSTLSMSVTVSGPLETPSFESRETKAAAPAAAPEQPPTPQSPPERSLPSSLPSPLPSQPPHQGVLHAPSGLWASTYCVDGVVRFPTTWYTHTAAPDFTVCSRCYVDDIWPTRLRSQFVGRFCDDGMLRRCRFSTPRCKEQLFARASAASASGGTGGDLQALTAFLARRTGMPDCFGVQGVTAEAAAKAGVRWFRARDPEAIPGFVVCEACFEDVVAASPAMAAHFEESPLPAARQRWACDLAMPFVAKEFRACATTGSWATFAAETRSRLSIPACPENTAVMLSSRKWFTPVAGPADMVICAACYCDHILKSGQEPRWQNTSEAALHTAQPGVSRCVLGQFSLRMALSVAADKSRAAAEKMGHSSGAPIQGDTPYWTAFWAAIDRVAYHEPSCSANGTAGARWLTFPSQPASFGVCGACCAAVLEPLGVADLFVPHNPPPVADEALLCSLNRAAERFPAYVEYLLETFYTLDARRWEAFAQKYAAVSLCPRDLDSQGRVWHGWPGCTVCPACYLDVVAGSVLDTDALMPLRTGAVLKGPQICELYSPRMRQLFQKVCESGDPAPLLATAEARRLVYWQTMPTCRQLLSAEKIKLMKATGLRMQSVLYNGMGGMIEAVSGPHTHTYSEAGVGSGFTNTYSLDGARYNVQANQVAATMGNNIHLVGVLEAQWRAVE